MYDEEGVFFHATSHQAAESISRGGFRLPSRPEEFTNGSSSGRGIYLHHQEHIAGAYGDHIVAAQIAQAPRSRAPFYGETIHSHPYEDEDVAHAVHERQRVLGGQFEDHLPAVLTEKGYRGHQDPDDHATVVYNPQHVQYLTHYKRGDA